MDASWAPAGATAGAASGWSRTRGPGRSPGGVAAVAAEEARRPLRGVATVASRDGSGVGAAGAADAGFSGGGAETPGASCSKSEPIKASRASRGSPELRLGHGPFAFGTASRGVKGLGSSASRHMRANSAAVSPALRPRSLLAPPPGRGSPRAESGAARAGKLPATPAWPSAGGGAWACGAPGKPKAGKRCSKIDDAGTRSRSAQEAPSFIPERRRALPGTEPS
mmetsp:Transcript_33789/g.71799  ORF Transcript_33789/g.71799 Transcript_33789/m.71799 type:complete len:224 (-) Transcript_33789:293-964(-)